jgi:RNA-directed DNA polymerase
LPWKKYQRNVFRLQKRIYQAARQGDWKRVHKLQRLLLRSWSARCLAVRQVSQDNRGKRTAGVDGVRSLTPKQRLSLARNLKDLTGWKVAPIRRKQIPKLGTTEKRGLGIPVMADRAMQALVKQVLEPEWEAQFESNSYGFRPGRSAHDAIGAIFNAICQKPKYVLDADIEKCFDRISHDALLGKLNTIPVMARLVRDWLKAGIVDKGELLFPEAGTPQGGVISPLLANIALHGFERAMEAVSRRYRIIVIRYADDFVVLCEDLETLLAVKMRAETWLAEMGLRLKAAKTHITHTLNEHERQTGFDFLGFHVRQYQVGRYRTRTYRGQPGFKTLITPAERGVKRHTEKIREIVHQYRGAPQAALIAVLNPLIRGWTQYYHTCVAKRTFNKMDHLLYWKLMGWAAHRHPRRSRRWHYQRYWRRQKGRIVFNDGKYTLNYYAKTPIVRHVKVRNEKSPYDGDWVYWGERLGRDPTKPERVIRLLKQQQGRCGVCRLHLTTEDVMEIHHRDGDQRNNRYTNLVLLHAHCHDQAHSGQYH